jgi:membrane-bound lytic murein transglycosylase A
VGPRSAQGDPRRRAADRRRPLAIPHGTVVWLDTTEPLSATPLRRLVMAQTAAAPSPKPVRADLFFGWTRQAQTSHCCMGAVAAGD